MGNKYYVYYQPNKKDIKDEYGDCVIRAMTKVLDKDWLEVFDEIVPIAREKQAPYNCRVCYEEYLAKKGFKYVGISNKKGSKRPTVKQFTKEHIQGRYVLRVAHHIVASVDGKYYDTWDSGDTAMYGYWVKEI